MSDLGERLLAIQGLDGELDAMHRRHMALEESLQASAELEAVRAGALEADRQVTDLARRQRDEEGELAIVQERMKKVSAALFGGSVTNPRELVTLEHDLANWKTQVTLHEDRVMEVMMALDEARIVRQTRHDDLAVAEKIEAQRTEQARREAAVVEEERAAIQRRRSLQASAIPADVLHVYDRLRTRYKGKVVVRLTNGACLGCGATLPSATVQRLRQDAGLPQCPACQRVLV